MKHFATPLLLAACAMAPMAALAQPANLELATAKNCMSCHNLERKVVGPAYKDVAAKYRGDKSAQDRLAAKIKSGGGGVWGVVKMPSNPQVNALEAKQLAAWVLSL